MNRPPRRILVRSIVERTPRPRPKTVNNNIQRHRENPEAVTTTSVCPGRRYLVSRASALCPEASKCRHASMWYTSIVKRQRYHGPEHGFQDAPAFSSRSSSARGRGHRRASFRRMSSWARLPPHSSRRVQCHCEDPARMMPSHPHRPGTRSLLSPTLVVIFALSRGSKYGAFRRCWRVHHHNGGTSP